MKYDDRYPLKDYLNSINLNKENLMDSDDPAWEKNYPAYVVNKCMSHHMRTDLGFDLSIPCNLLEVFVERLPTHGSTKPT